MELSGTSFSAPIVSGIAALILGKHPEFTPDQVKGALILGAKPLPKATDLSEGVGEVNAGRSVEFASPLRANVALTRFVVSDPVTGAPVFDSASWAEQAKSDASWAAASWAAASWDSASWAEASWSSASWAEASWSDASWASASWASDAAGCGVLGRPEPRQRLLGRQRGG
jgi:subtilisin family serine protease